MYSLPAEEPRDGLAGQVDRLVELAPEGGVDVGLRQDVAVAVAVKRVLLRETETCQGRLLNFLRWSL